MYIERLARSASWTCTVCKTCNSDLLSDEAPHASGKEQDTPTPNFTLAYPPSANASETPSQKKEDEGSEKETDTKDTKETVERQSAQESSRAHAPTLPSLSSQSRQGENSSSPLGSTPPPPTAVHADRQRPPIWLDGIIGCLVSLLIALIVRRFVF